jgi:hypothetical protein
MKLLDGHIDVVWDIDPFLNLEYKKDTIKTSYELSEFAAGGHDFDNMIVYNYFEPNPMPLGVEFVKKQFEKYFDCVSIAVNLFVPGSYVPYHHDLYQKYCTVNNITKDQDIYRFIVMLEDGQHGQMLQIGKTVHYLWKAGDYFGWKNDEVHASYNMSMRNRYALQVTASK